MPCGWVRPIHGWGKFSKCGAKLSYITLSYTPFTQSKVLSTYPTKNIVCTKEGDERKMKAQKGHIILKLQEFKGSSSLLVQHITNWNENGRWVCKGWRWRAVLAPYDMMEFSILDQVDMIIITIWFSIH